MQDYLHRRFSVTGIHRLATANAGQPRLLGSPGDSYLELQSVTDLTTGATVFDAASAVGATKDATVSNRPSTSLAVPNQVHAPGSVNTSPNTPVTGQQFAFTIAGSGLDPSSAEVFFLGPGCPTSTSCVVPNKALTTNTTMGLAGSTTLANGDFTVQVRNTSSGSVSNAGALFVAKQSGMAPARVLVLLVSFADEPGQTPRDYFREMLFADHPPQAPQGSFTDYYKEVSYNHFDVDGTVNNATTAWITLPQSAAYYAGNSSGLSFYPLNAQKMVEDAVIAARNLGIDFGPFDADGDGFVDALFVIHAGPGFEITGNQNDIHSHSWATTYPVDTGSLNSAKRAVYVSRYTTEPEYLWSPGDLTIGVFAHEYGHMRWGLPDLYDTDYSSEGIGNWSLMAGGSWNGSPLGSSPSHLDAWSKYFVGFITPTMVSSALPNQTITQAETSATAYQLLSGSPTTEIGEYFLVENRQRTGFDSGLPSAGLLIWHIDESQSTNDSEGYPGCLSCTGHYKVQLIQADNSWELEKDVNRGSVGDPYPGLCGINICRNSLTSATLPNSNLWNGRPSGVSVTNISASGSVMTATLTPTSGTVPSLRISNTHIGEFNQGQLNAQYTILVSNASNAAPTSGTITVTDTLPVGLTLVSMYGSGWTCTVNTCNRNDSLNSGSSYAVITVLVDVGLNATSPQINTVTVSGGGSQNASASDPTNIILLAPDLTISSSHSGGFAQGQTGTTYTLTVSNVGLGATAGTVSVTESVPVGLSATAITGFGWACTQPSGPCTRSDALPASSVYPTITFTANVATNAPASVTNTVSVTGGGDTNAGNNTATDLTTILPSVSVGYVLTVSASPVGAGYVIANPPSGDGTYLSGATVCLTAASAQGWVFNNWSGDSLDSSACLVMTGNKSVVANFVAGPDVSSGLRFVPVTPCRVADTRNPNGPFGGPMLSPPAAGLDYSRDFVVPNSTCGIPANAQAYAFNVTVVPQTVQGLRWLTVWPAGLSRPKASTITSTDGRVKAVSAIVAPGAASAIRIFVTNPTHVVLDITGYFVSATDPAGFAFYPLAPCRIADTRTAAGPLGGPSLPARSTRDFAVLDSPCSIPPGAVAYSLNLTAVPGGKLGYMTAWPAGQPRPHVSALNAPTGTPTANASILPAGEGGSISVYVTDTSDLVIDINGYFAPATSGGLSLYTFGPCRVLETRPPTGTGPFAGAIAVSFPASSCAVPQANAYLVNATVIPPARFGYLTLWPWATPQPFVSTLSAWDGTITSNMAIVPASNGSISAYARDTTNLVIDVFGYFAP
jgi:immune inhibitor A